MNPDVTEYIAGAAPWQAEIMNAIRERVHQAVPAVEERIQYKKPHFLKDGHYLAVLSPAKAYVAFMIFNAQELEAPAGFFERQGPPERKTIKIKEGQDYDGDLLGQLVAQAASTL